MLCELNLVLNVSKFFFDEGDFVESCCEVILVDSYLGSVLMLCELYWERYLLGRTRV